MNQFSHENIFLQSYSRLRAWAIQIAEQNHSLAEDLLHDAFIQFTRAQPSLDGIENLDGYLYGIIRHLYHSHLRKTLRRSKHRLSIVDFETVRLGLSGTNVQESFQTQDELKQICYYVCLRKETSRAASVMILRFFHGYFPSEIAEVLRTTAQAVKVRLRLARIEAKEVLEEPRTLKAIEEKLSPELTLTKYFRSHADLTVGLGELIFRSNLGSCLADEELARLYRKMPPEPVDTKRLAHFVSCRACLEKINSLLGLPPISERYAIDFIGKNNGDQDKTGGSGGSMTNDLNNGIRTKLRRQAQEVFEHEPQELLISVNGSVAGSQKIEKNLNELSLAVSSGERLEYIEIFSEQNVRLAFLSLDGEAFPDGASKTIQIDFSDDRALTLALRREAEQTKIDLVYLDPQFEEIEKLVAAKLRSNNLSEIFTENSMPEGEKLLFSNYGENARKGFLGRLLGGVKAKLIPPSFGLPQTAAAALLVFLAVGAFFVARRSVFVPEVSAREILAQAERSEEQFEQLTGAVLLRTIFLEEHAPGGELINRKRIETHADAIGKLTVRRLYDEKNQLVAGEWRRKDGVSTVYRAGALPELRSVVSDRDLLNGQAKNLWRFSVSAKGFQSLIEAPERAAVKKQNDDYVIEYQTGKLQGLVKAVLYLNAGMRSNRQVLTFRSGEDEREYRFTETKFETRPAGSLEKTVFEPEKSLTGQAPLAAAVHNQTETIAAGKNEEANSANSNAQTPSGELAATPELELKVLQLLNNVNALSGDQISILKTPNGKLSVSGIVDAKSRKDEILNSLSELRNNPGLKINILTAEEAAKNKSAQKAPNEVENIELETKNPIPAAEILRNHFAGGGASEEKISAEVRRYSSSVLAKSAQMRRSALALKQIAERFSAGEIEKMDEAARERWRQLLGQNAGNLLRQSENLRDELRPIFKTEATGAGANFNPQNPSEIARAAKRLFDLSLAIEKDVRASFTVSGGSSTVIPVKAGKFGENLGEIITLARKF